MSASDESRPEGKVFPLRRLTGTAAELTDAALVAACAVGDGAALGALFDRHSRALYRFTSRLSGVSRVDLDDMVSATFLEACRSASAFRGDSSVLTWLFGIAVNVARHQARGDGRRRAFLDQYQQLPQQAASDRPDDAAERRQLIAKLDVILGSLPHDLRVAFVMCDIEEVPCAEAALGLRQGTVWKRLHRARKLLGDGLT
ncbi:MAG TPA: RNA polymerase sigma factor [Polyangia bacterium]|jgi:RNA polymerase sigma-70 factor (ECF subfamily)|nr:RNA polymerase sigma factor [Polyangia bacterium]